MALAAGAQSYAVMLPGIIAFGVGLATSTSSITMTAIDGVPATRLGVASALPNISRYIGGAFGAAVLGAVLHANLPASVEDALGRVDADGRGLVADGFRSALLIAAVFLLVAALAASRMPRLGARQPVPAAAAAAPLDAPATR
jgi:hypothetical protein